MDRDAHDIIVDRSELLAALEWMTGESGDVVLFTATGAALTLERCEHVTSVAATYEGPTLHVAIDPTFAADAVRGAVGAEVVIEVTDSLRPVVFRSADDGTYTTMIMPVRLA